MHDNFVACIGEQSVIIHVFVQHDNLHENRSLKYVMFSFY